MINEEIAMEAVMIIQSEIIVSTIKMQIVLQESLLEYVSLALARVQKLHPVAVNQTF